MKENIENDKLQYFFWILNDTANFSRSKMNFLVVKFYSILFNNYLTVLFYQSFTEKRLTSTSLKYL